MASLSDDQLARIRTEIGDTTPPTDADLDDILTRVIAVDNTLDVPGAVPYVVGEVLRKRLANLLSSPSSFSVPGEYSQSTADNIKTLEAQVAQFPSLTGGVGGGTVRIVAPAARSGR